MVVEDRLAPTEILDAVEHAFVHQDRLACEMEGALEACNGWDRGVTRLAQIRDFYSDIKADMTRFARQRPQGSSWDDEAEGA
jgi:hypothetical protein